MDLLTLIGRRGVGKTAGLILECERLNIEHGVTDVAIIVSHSTDARRVRALAQQLGCTHTPCYTMSELTRHPDFKFRWILLDDIDRIIQQFCFPYTVLGYSATQGDDNGFFAVHSEK